MVFYLEIPVVKVSGDVCVFSTKGSLDTRESFLSQLIISFPCESSINKLFMLHVNVPYCSEDFAKEYAVSRDISETVDSSNLAFASRMKSFFNEWTISTFPGSFVCVCFRWCLKH